MPTSSTTFSPPQAAPACDRIRQFNTVRLPFRYVLAKFAKFMCRNLGLCQLICNFADMENVAKNILGWIEDFNREVFNRNQNYQVNPIYLRKNQPSNCITLHDIIDCYVKFLVDDFANGLINYYLLQVRVYLPTIRALFPLINGIRICDESILWLDELGKNTSIEYLVLGKILELTYPTIQKDKSIKQYGIKLFNVGGAVFADVFYVFTSIKTIEEFNLWVENISRPGSMTPNFTVNNLDKLNCKILFDGDISELYKIPRSVDVTMIHYLTVWDEENIVADEERKVTLSVNVSDDNFIVLSYPKTKLYRDYYDEIINSMNIINTNLFGYHLVDGALYNKAKALYDNKIKCDIFGYEDYFISELIKGKQVYDMAMEKDSNTWDGCIGPIVMVDVPQYELTKNHDAVYRTMGFLIKMIK